MFIPCYTCEKIFVILFYPHNDIHGSRLEKAVAPVVQQETIVVFHELVDLLEYLKQPNSKHRVLLFQAVSKDQLQQLGRNSALLDNLKKILVLPDASNTVIQIACTLYPSYITNVFSDYKDVRDVLTKLKSRFSML